MPNTHAAHEVLSNTPDDDRATGRSDNDAQWVSVEDILYQNIVITRANVMDKYDEARQKNRTFAYVNFHYSDDETETPYVFRTGWQKIRKQIATLNALKAAGDDPYPVECGVAEILVDNPLIGDDGVPRFPLQLLPFEMLDAAETAATSYALRTPPATPAPAPAPATAPTARPQAAPSAPVAAPSAARSTAARAGKPSAASRNLTTRGN